MKKNLFVVAMVIVMVFMFGPSVAAAGGKGARDKCGRQLEKAYKEFAKTIRKVGKNIEKHPLYENASAQEKAEAMRFVSGIIRTTIANFIMDDPEFPKFIQSPDPTARYGLDNPDNLYLGAGIQDDAEYRVWGNRGTSADLAIQLYDSITTTGGSTIDVSTLIVEPDGTFELIVSADDPGTGGNWLQLTPGMNAVLARYAHNDWVNEFPGRIHIEKIGNEGKRSDILTEAAMIENLSAAAERISYNVMAWPNWAYNIYQSLPPNWLPPIMGADAANLGGQYRSVGYFELEDDQALIVTTKPSWARYQGFQLGNTWFTSMEYANRQTSLTAGTTQNPGQAHLSSDGIYRFVISKDDPGVPNWLDTEGHNRGMIHLRWQGWELGGSPYGPPDHWPVCQVVPLEDIRDYFPDDVPIYTEADREAQLYERQVHVQERYGW